ncbi:MAG TPA: hypothetical protein VI548_04470 [Chitinophagaceae bacterium]|nr:hypothetical protein [Chitinophagaceae bacterium]
MKTEKHDQQTEIPVSSIESLFERTAAFGNTTLELTKLRVLETTTRVVTSLVTRISVILMLSLFLLIINIGIALYLGDLLGKTYYGFFIVAVFYLVLGFVFYSFLHQWIKKPLSELIIKQALQ